MSKLLSVAMTESGTAIPLVTKGMMFSVFPHFLEYFLAILVDVAVHLQLAAIRLFPHLGFASTSKHFMRCKAYTQILKLYFISSSRHRISKEQVSTLRIGEKVTAAQIVFHGLCSHLLNQKY
jgi:hypothetical protein